MTYCLYGQFCATPHPENIPSDFHNYQQRSIATRSGKMDTIIIYPIVGVNKNEISAVELEVLEQVILEANRLFEKVDMYFRMCSHPFLVQDEKLWDLDIHNSNDIHAKYGQASVINLYIPNFFFIEDGYGQKSSICGIATFPSEDLDTRLVIINGECISEPYVLAHELGHYYGLYHTHENSLGRELVRRINCGEAGDLMCDTDADPRLSDNNIDDCFYTGKDKDREGNLYIPPVRNVMSYAPFNCKLEFTPEQYLRMRYVQDFYYSSYTSKCGLPDYALKMSKNQIEFSNYNKFKVEFEVENLGVMDEERLEIDIYLIDERGTKKAVLKSLEVKINSGNVYLFKEEIRYSNFLNEKNQYMVIEIDPQNKIREFDKSNNSSRFPLQFDDRNDHKENIYPNPFKNNLQISISDIKQRGNINLTFFDTTGKIVKESMIRKDYLNFYHNVDLSSLAPGIYVLSVSLDKELYYLKKMVKL